MAMGSGVFTPALSLSWAHEFGDTVQEVGMRFAEAPSGGSFSVISSETARDAALVDAGASYTIGAGAEMGLYYTGRFSQDLTAQSVTARFSYRF